MAEEPIILFSKGDMCVKYRLMEDSWERAVYDMEISDEEFDAIENWICLKKGDLFRELELHHFIQFERDSSCYFDFISLRLFGARGTKDNKPINGEPVNFTPKQLRILETLVKNRDAHCEYDLLYLAADISTETRDSALRALTVHINNIRNYDNSLRNTIENANEGYRYTGRAESWVIGNDFLRSHNEEGAGVALEKIFSLISHLKVLVSNTKPNGESSLRVTLSESATITDKFAFFIPTDFINADQSPSIVEALFQGNKLDSDTFIINIYKKVSRGDFINKLWDHIKAWIFENYKASISASSYYGMNDECPKTIKEVFENPPRDYTKYIQRIYSPTKEFIENSIVAEDFFKKRNIDIEKEKTPGVDIFDYIVALVLASFYYCRCIQTDEITQLRKLYRDKLYVAIQERFSAVADTSVLPPMTGQEEQDYLSTCQMIEELYALAEAAGKQFNIYYGVEKFKLSKNKFENDASNNHNATPGKTR